MAVFQATGMSKNPNYRGKPSKSVRYTKATKETQTYTDELPFSGPSLSDKTRYGNNFVLPTVEERLAQLHPSKELLDFYRKKISEYDDEADEMIKRINCFLETCEKQYELEAELRQREKEIAALQEALSDLQVCLFQEREHVLQLYAQIDSLKVKDFVRHRKKQKPLKTLPKEHEEDDIICFVDKDSDIIIPQYGQGKPWFKISDQTRSMKPVSRELHSRHHVCDEDQIQPSMPLRSSFYDSENLCIQVKTLEMQLEEQKQLSQGQVEALTEECRVVRAEAKAHRMRDIEKINTLSSKLKQAQELLHQSTRDFIELRRSTRTNEKLWMIEKDQLLQEIGTVRELSKEVEKKKNKSNDQRPPTVVIQTHSPDKTDRSKEVISEIKSLKTQLGQMQKLAEMYQAQAVKSEDKISQLKEEKSFSQDLYKDRTDKLNSRLQVLNSRYQDLEKRRRIEIEGFRSDIKELKSNLKDIEKQVWKAAIHIGEDNKDLVMLQTIKETSERSNQLTGDLKGLKAKLYRLENDLRHL